MPKLKEILGCIAGAFLFFNAMSYLGERAELEASKSPQETAERNLRDYRAMPWYGLVVSPGAILADHQVSRENTPRRG